MKDINIVLLNYFMKDDILRAIDSLVLDIKNSIYDVQITVADNSENKDNIKEELVKKFPQVNYIDCGGNIGFGAGNNKGFKSCEARYYFALNRDTIIPENSNTITKIIEFMDSHPKIACIGPKLLNMDGSLQYSCYRFDLASILIKPLKQINLDKKYKWIKKHADKLIMKDFDHEKTMPVDWVLGAALVIRKETVEDIGWFDERYFMYLEDCDWCHRMWEKNWPVYYVCDIIILHAHARESAKVPGLFKAVFKNKLARIHANSWIKYLWKWRGNHKYYKTKY
jgi:GT2 family glycosyltransferase